MSKNNNELTDEEITKFIKGPLDKKLDVTRKLGNHYTSMNIDGTKKDVAEKLFRVILQDTETEVRKTLSESIKLSNDIPHDIVFELANDINEVSIPILEFSDVISDEDLISIIKQSDNVAKQNSIAKRRVVSENVSENLIETNKNTVVETLLKNTGSQIDAKNYDNIIDNFSGNIEVLESLVTRDTIPVNILENIANKVSDEIYSSLAQKHSSILQNIDKAKSETKNIAKMKAIGLKSSENEFHNFCILMKKLNIPNELMPICALCAANLNLFEVCIARKLKVPLVNLRSLLEKANTKVFRSIYEKSMLPMNLIDATEALFLVVKGIDSIEQHDGIHISRQLSSRMIAKLMMYSEEAGEIDNIDYIVTLIKHNVSISEQANAV